MTVNPEDLIEGAPVADTTASIGSVGTTRRSPYPEFDQDWTAADRQYVRRSMRPIRAYVASGATPNPAAVSAAIERAGAWQKRQQAKAAEIVANRNDYVELAARLDGLGRAHPYLGADVAFALAMSGHGADSDAAMAAAQATAATSSRYGQSSIPEASTDAMTAKAALEYVRINAGMSQADLVTGLRAHGFDPESVQGFTWDGSQFRTISDTSVTVPLDQVLAAEADLEDDADNGGVFGDIFGGVKWFSRGATSFLFAPWEALNASMRENYADMAADAGGYENLGADDKLLAIVGAFGGRGWDEGWDETTFAEASRQLWRHGEMNAGTGWLMGGSVEATKTARDYAWYANQIGDDPATMGRLSASTVLKPGSIPYGLASGLVDATGSLAFDPSTYVPLGWFGKGTRIAGLTRATHWLDWAADTKKVTIAAKPTLLDEAGKALDDVGFAGRQGRFPSSADAPRMRDQAGLIDGWADRWYTGGAPSDAALLKLLKGGKEQVESIGLKVRSRRKVDGLEPIRLEFDPAGVRGYIDTDPAGDWARQLDRSAPYSTQVVPVGETVDDFAARLVKIDLQEPLDSAHPLNEALNSLVTDRGWNVVRRNISVTTPSGQKATRQVTSLFRPDQQLPAGTRVSPFTDTVDEATGEVTRTLTGGTGLDSPLSNWSPAVTADLGPGTFLLNFPEVRAVRTQEIFDRNPIAAVTNTDLLDDIPPTDSFRVMYQTEQLRGGVDVEAGAEQITQSVFRENPTAAWGKPTPPKEISYDEALAQATKEVDTYVRTNREKFHQQALDRIEEMENAAVGGARPGFIRSLSRPDQERALRDGEVPLEDLLNAYGPDEVEDLARYLEHGPVPEDRVAGVRGESELAVNDQVVYDAIDRAVGREQAAKVIEAWRAGKPVKVRTKAEMKALAQPEQVIVGRVVDDAGNVIDPGKVRVKRTRRVGGGKKITVNIPGINVAEDIRTEALRWYGDPTEIATYLKEQNAAERAAIAAADDAPPIYAIEKADLAHPVGKAEAGYPEWRLFDTARTAAANADDIAAKGHRVVAVRRKGNRPAKIADLNDTEVSELVRAHLTERLNAIVDSLAGRDLPFDEGVWAVADRFEALLANNDVTGALRAFREFVARLPESQGQTGARAAAEMERVLDIIRADGYDAVKWSDGGKTFYELLDPRQWVTSPVKKQKVSDRTVKVSDAWDDQQFGVRFSARQPALYDQMAQIDAPKGKPPKMSSDQWQAWTEQRQRLIDRGWTVDDTPHGREVLRRPLAGEYDGKAGDELHRAMPAGDVSRGTDAEVGINRVGTRETVVPEQFYSFITRPKLRPHWEKIAATSSYEEIVRLVGEQPVEVIARLMRASTGDEVLEALIESAGLKELRRLSVAGANAERLRGAADAVLHHTPGFRKGLDDIRLLHVMPGQYVNLHDADQAAREMHNWLMTAKVPKAERDQVMADLLTQGTSFGRKEIYFSVFGDRGPIAASMRQHMAKAWKRGKTDEEVNAAVHQMLTLFRREHERNAAYHLKAPGEKGYVSGTALASNDEIIPSPMLLGDFYDGVLPLPNPRDIKRITGIIGRMAASGYDVKRAHVLDGLIRALDGYNTFFKVTALARIAYPVRVLMEEQGRLYGTGYVNVYNHPLQMILHTYKGNRGTDLMGRSWRDLATDPEPNAYADALVNSRLLLDNDDSVKFLANHYIPVGPEDDRYLDGWMFQLGKMHADPLARRLVGKWTTDELASMPQSLVDEGNPVKMVAYWLTEHRTGKEYLTSLREASHRTLPDFSSSLRRVEGVEAFVKEIDDEIRYLTAQGDPALVEAIKTGRLAAGDDTIPMFVNPAVNRGGQVYNGAAFKKALANYRRLDNVPQRVIAPDAMVSREQFKLWDRAVTQMFSYLNSRPTNYLSRSPVFRETYWTRVADYLHVATDDAAEKILRQAADSGITSQQRKALERAFKKRAGGDKANLTASDIDALAKDDALEKVKELLYDTSNKTHLWDALRIAAPFGAAWSEVLKTWTRIAWNNPKVLDRLAHGIHGAQQEGSSIIYDVTGTPHDSDQGFFFKDLRTGDESFAWPMPPQFQQFLAMGTPSSSAGVMMPAPVAGLNLIGQVQPGFGPIVTAPAAMLLNQPGWKEDVLNFIAPFGGPSVEDSGGVANAIMDSVTPAWLRKLLTAVYPVNAEQKAQLASATLAAQVHLASTGKYDLGDPTEAERLLADAQGMAKRIYMLRAIGQFVLPTIGSPEQAAMTGNGELVLQVKLAAMLRQYQSDPGEGGYGYQEGYIRFLRDFGSDLYLMGVDRSESTGYMAPTRGTYDWMRRHPDLMAKYDKVWGLLVDDPGTEFYYPAYQAQVRQGYRTMIDPEKLVEMANARLGRALYTAYRSQYGEYPDEDQAAQLRSLQDSLELQFPGYTRIPETGFTTPGKILQLERAAKDPQVQALPVGASLSTYFAKRQEYRSMGISSFRTGEGREVAPELYALGEQLAASDPTFRVAWDRLL